MATISDLSVSEMQHVVGGSDLWDYTAETMLVTAALAGGFGLFPLLTVAVVMGGILVLTS